VVDFVHAELSSLRGMTEALPVLEKRLLHELTLCDIPVHAAETSDISLVIQDRYAIGKKAYPISILRGVPVLQVLDGGLVRHRVG